MLKEQICTQNLYIKRRFQGIRADDSELSSSYLQWNILLTIFTFSHKQKTVNSMEREGEDYVSRGHRERFSEVDCGLSINQE